MKDKIDIIVPCFNESDSIKLFYNQLLKDISLIDVDFQIIFVDDGSKDNTLKIIKEISNKDNRIKYISFSRNFGKEAAMYAGLQYATGDFAVIMDADLQHPPKKLIEMYNILKNNEDVDSVASRRISRKGESKIRSFFANLFYKFNNSVSEVEIVSGAQDFRLMRKKMYTEIIKMSEKRRFSKGLFSWVGFKTQWIECENVERVAGSTKWSFKTLSKYAIEGIINFSTAFLNIPFVFSALFLIVSLVLGILSFCNLTDIDIALGIISAICFVTSMVLMCLGILGMYISRIFTETKNRPIYIERETNFN